MIQGTGTLQKAAKLELLSTITTAQPRYVSTNSDSWGLPSTYNEFLDVTGII